MKGRVIVHSHSSLNELLKKHEYDIEQLTYTRLPDWYLYWWTPSQDYNYLQPPGSYIESDSHTYKCCWLKWDDKDAICYLFIYFVLKTMSEKSFGTWIENESAT